MAGEHRMYRCLGCATAFVYPTPTNEFLAAFYAGYHQSESEGGWYDTVEDRMRGDFPAKVGLVMQATGGKPGRLLDVGCGKGYFVKECVGHGIDAEGIDLSTSGVEHARQKLGVKATQGLLSEVRSQLGLFDCATFWATIEHLPDPIATIRDIASVLKPGGKLLLDTGIGNDWLDRLLPGRVQWYDPPQHLFVFSAEGMRRAVERAGLRVVRLDRNYERSAARKVMKNVRNGVVAAGMRVAAEVGRLRHTGFVAMRFPIGNLMSVTAEKA